VKGEVGAMKEKKTTLINSLKESISSTEIDFPEWEEFTPLLLGIPEEVAAVWGELSLEARLIAFAVARSNTANI
jgi:hypothetical protein